MCIKIKRIKRWLPAEIRRRLKPKALSAYKEIPIIINNYNRLSMLSKLIDSLTVRGYHNIHIIDNASTYPPLLEWYESCPYKVFRLDENVGHLAFWETGIYKQFWGQYIAYTDSDMEIIPECPDDFIERFVSLLDKYPYVLKVGFSIAIDDLPDCFDKKDAVQDWESQFWKREIEPEVYIAPIDTTFAVYKPYFKGEIVYFKSKYLRTGYPYTIRHLPWYKDSANLDEEELYYLSHIKTSTHWSEQAAK